MHLTGAGGDPLPVPLERDYDLERSLVDLVFDHAKETPDAVAIEFDGGTVSYDRLAREVVELANRLVARGVGPGDRVGLYMAPTPYLVRSMLAVMAAGAAYVSLDIDDARERTRFVVDDASVDLVLVDQEGSAALSAVDVEMWEADQPLAGEDGPPPHRVGSESAAYVIYTSGSTGKPKGTIISHRALTNYLLWVDEFLLSRIHKLPAVSKASFDACLVQILAPLAGGRLVWMLPSGWAKHPLRLAEALTRNKDVGINCVPTLWSAVLEEFEMERVDLPDSLSAVFLGAERLPSPLLERTRRLFPDTDVINLYGPTETTGNVTWALIMPDDPISIGTPVANMRVIVVGDALEPLPVGRRGEILIGGPNVSNGYLNQPDLSRRAFVELDEFPGVQFYRSGDLGQVDESGRLRFLGRLDNQIKLRGYRIELGEIENAVEACRGVRECAAVVAAENVAHPHIVAFLGTELELDARALRRQLRDSLPSYMLPSRFVMLGSLPRLPNNKVDRLKLDSWTQGGGKSSSGPFGI